ncbi:MAG: 50S ribosomal protein L10 [Candidatus Omnitrophica bacterium]|nr:50S ribosomal protein L10 [Candidatus Omnitrophota bacterium]
MEKFGQVSKKYMVDSISERFKNYPDFFITTFSNVGVNDMEQLRKDLRKKSSHYMVVKNSMLRMALKSSGKDVSILDYLDKQMMGSCGIVFSKNDPAIAARSLVEFNKNFEGLKIQGAVLNGEKIGSDAIKLLATLPSRETLLAMVASGIKSPITGFVGLLGGIIRNFVGVIHAISNKKNES